MKKLTILYIVAILLVSFAYAEDELVIDSIKVYVNDDKKSGVDEDGGDFNALRDDIVDFVVDLNNERDNTTRVKLNLVVENIDDDDDIEKEIDWFDIDANDDKTKTISFVVPFDARIDNYNIELTIHYEWEDGTNGDYNIDYDMDVEEEEEEERELDLKGSFDNLTMTCSNIIDSMNGFSECLGYIDTSAECKDELSTVKEERGNCMAAKEAATADVTDLQLQRDNLQSEMKDLENQVNQKESQISTMMTQSECTQLTTTAVSEAEKKSSMNLLMLAGGGIAIFLIWRTKKQTATVPDTYYYEKKA